MGAADGIFFSFPFRQSQARRLQPERTFYFTCKNSFMPQAFVFLLWREKKGFALCQGTWFELPGLPRLMSKTVISGGDRTRMGGPQVPVPLLAYSRESAARR